MQSPRVIVLLDLHIPREVIQPEHVLQVRFFLLVAFDEFMNNILLNQL